MRKVSIRQFRSQMAKELRDLPFALTRSGEIICEMRHQNDPIFHEKNIGVQKQAFLGGYIPEAEYIRGKVYFVGDGHWDEPGSCMKIGFSKNGGEYRLSALQIGNPKELVFHWEMPGEEFTERQVHELFSDFHIRGEWFNYNEDFADLLVGLSFVACGLITRGASYRNYLDRLSVWMAAKKRPLDDDDERKYLSESCAGWV